VTDHLDYSIADAVSSITTGLVNRARERDADAWAVLVRTYTRLVYFWCRSKLPQPADAENVAQDVFLAVSNGIDKFQGNSDAFRGWIRTITTRQIANYWRKNENEPEVPGGSDLHDRIDQIPSANEPSGSSMFTNEQIEEDTRVLYSALVESVRDSVTQQTWDAFSQYVLDRRDPRDVATDLGMSPGAVYTAKSRVLKHLRQELSKLGVQEVSGLET
jgi:RNA polymerase sigma factor (sigma-70 family)